MRITSSDPSSSLSSSPIQLELDTRGGPSTVISKPLLSGSGATEHSSSSSAVQVRPGSSSSTSTASSLLARRRKESGKLANGSPSRQQHTARLPGRHHEASPRVASPKRAPGILTARDGERNPLQELQRSSEEAHKDMPLLSSSPNSTSSTFASADSGDEAASASAAPRSILKRKQELWSSLPDIANSLPSPNMLYPSSQGLFPGLAWSGSDHQQGFPSTPSPYGSFARPPPSPPPSQPLPQPPPPPPPAPTSSSTSAGASDGGTNRPPVPPPPPASFFSRLPPGARQPSFRASTPRLGTLSPAQARAAWPSQRVRSIKLVEPSWEPYVDLHERARERLETAARLAGGHPRAASNPSLPLLPWDDSDDEQDEEAKKEGVEGEEEEEEEGVDGRGDVQKRRANRRAKGRSANDDAEFWFERYTRSTAAAGKDWDWRKRRARQRAQAAASMSAPSPNSSHWSANNGNEQNGVFQGSDSLRRMMGPPPALQLNGLGGTMHQSGNGDGSPSLEARRRLAYQQAPLVSFSQNELPNKPDLAINVTANRKDQQVGGRTSPSKSPNGNDNPSSPLSKAFKSLLNGGTSSEVPDSPSLNRRSSLQPDSEWSGGLHGRSSPTPQQSSAVRLRKGVNKMMNRSSTVDGPLPTAPPSAPDESPRRSRRVSETDSKDADEDSTAPSLPSRISSLSPRNRLNSLRGMTKKERGAVLTAQLLKEAEAVGTDDDEEDDFRVHGSPDQASNFADIPQGHGEEQDGDRPLPRGALGLRTSSSSSSIPLADGRGNSTVGAGSEGGWSSADAYGLASSSSYSSSSSPPMVGGIQAAGVFGDIPVFLSASPPDDDGDGGARRRQSSNPRAAAGRGLPVQQAQISDGGSSSVQGLNAGAQAFPLFNGGEPMAKKSSSRGSSTGEGNPPVMIPARRRTGSRKGILSSATSASASPARASPERKAANRDSMGRAMTEARSPHPAPAMQPEPAPLQMANRARSASINKQERLEPATARSSPSVYQQQLLQSQAMMKRSSAAQPASTAATSRENWRNAYATGEAQQLASS